MKNRLTGWTILCLFAIVLLIPLGAVAAPLSPAGKALLKDAASYNLMEIQLGQLAQTRAAAAEVKEYADRMVADHSNSNQELKAIAAQKNLRLPAQVARKHVQVIAKVSELTGAEFDRSYLQAMVQAHSAAVKRLKKGLRKVQDPDLASWAEARLPSLQEHLRQAGDLARKLRLR